MCASRHKEGGVCMYGCCGIVGVGLYCLGSMGVVLLFFATLQITAN